jgi:hypothetical protein
MHFPDGVKEIIFPDGTRKVINPDGLQVRTVIEKVDCTFLHVTVALCLVIQESHFPDGVILREHPDGRKEVLSNDSL